MKSGAETAHMQPEKWARRWINHPNAKTALQTRREAADSTLVRQGFATKYEGLYWRLHTINEQRKTSEWQLRR